MDIEELKINYPGFEISQIDLGQPEDRYYLLLREISSVSQEIKLIKIGNDGQVELQYSDILNGYPQVLFYTRFWDAVGEKALLLFTPPQGSGGFISYQVLGIKDGKIVQFIAEEDIFLGSISFEGYRLIRGTGNQFRVWKKIRGRFILQPYRVPTYPGAVVIRYSVNSSSVTVEKRQYVLPVGTTVQFIREDFNPVTSRILFSSQPSDCLEFIRLATFKLTCPTTVTATIIPEGYNWDAAANIRIIVQ